MRRDRHGGGSSSVILDQVRFQTSRSSTTPAPSPGGPDIPSTRRLAQREWVLELACSSCRSFSDRLIRSSLAALTNALRSLFERGTYGRPPLGGIDVSSNVRYWG